MDWTALIYWRLSEISDIMVVFQEKVIGSIEVIWANLVSCLRTIVSTEDSVDCDVCFPQVLAGLEVIMLFLLGLSSCSDSIVWSPKLDFFNRTLIEGFICIIGLYLTCHYLVLNKSIRNASLFQFKAGLGRLFLSRNLNEILLLLIWGCPVLITSTVVDIWGLGSTTLSYNRLTLIMIMLSHCWWVGFAEHHFPMQVFRLSLKGSYAVLLFFKLSHLILGMFIWNSMWLNTLGHHLLSLVTLLLKFSSFLCIGSSSRWLPCLRNVWNSHSTFVWRFRDGQNSLCHETARLSHRGTIYSWWILGRAAFVFISCELVYTVCVIFDPLYLMMLLMG